MRIALAAIPLLLLGACQVSKDDANGTTSVTYNSDVAENAAADVGNTAQNIAADIGNEAKAAGDKIGNKVGNTDDNTAGERQRETDNRRLASRSRTSSGRRLVGETGFEPATLCSQSRCATRLRHSPPSPKALAGKPPANPAGLPAVAPHGAKAGGPGRIRTSNLAVMSGRLYR